jgi:hypothetical protein
MSDPVIWYTVNAQLDGVDTGSDNLQERMKFFVYQRRMMLDTVKTRAMLLAMMGNTEAAAKTAQNYIDMAMPLTEESRLQQEASLDEKMKEFSKMEPVDVVNTGRGLLMTEKPKKQN